MIGQEKFMEKLDKYTLSNLPHSILLLGDKGSGHEDVCLDLAFRLGLYLFENINDNINHEFIDQIYLNSNPSLYTINIENLTEKDQNILLKLFEEPNALTYIILYGETTSTLLETIVNRSYIMQLDKYTKDQLEPLIQKGDKDYILSLCTTPGQIEIANHTDTDSLKTLCETILGKMNLANFANALTIANKVNFKDEYDKYDLYLFIKALGYEMLRTQNLSFYKHLQFMNKYIWVMNDKKRYFEQFIIKLWKCARGL